MYTVKQNMACLSIMYLVFGNETDNHISHENTKTSNANQSQCHISSSQKKRNNGSVVLQLIANRIILTICFKICRYNMSASFDLWYIKWMGSHIIKDKILKFKRLKHRFLQNSASKSAKKNVVLYNPRHLQQKQQQVSMR